MRARLFRQALTPFPFLFTISIVGNPEVIHMAA
jgi:hypothetical protein